MNLVDVCEVGGVARLVHERRQRREARPHRLGVRQRREVRHRRLQAARAREGRERALLSRGRARDGLVVCV